MSNLEIKTYSFDTVELWKKLGIDYFSSTNSKEKKLKRLWDTEYSELYNQWVSYEGSNGADVRCELAEINGELKIVVYGYVTDENNNRDIDMETMSIYDFTAENIQLAIAEMYNWVE